LEHIIGESKTHTRNKRAPQNKEKNSLPDHIIESRDIGFFSQPKTAEEVHQKLKGKYHADENRISMALLRLGNRRELRKTSKIIGGKKYKAYVW
jgi:hypothetical protein